MSLSILFQKIEQLVPTLDGWCTPERASELAAIVIGLKPRISVCLGVWGGRDTFAMALAHQYNGVGKVVAIDPWSAPASIEGQNGANAEWWANQQNHDIVYGRFIQNLNTLGVTEYVDVRRERSDNVEPPAGIGLLIIDGNHGEQALTDTKRYAANVEIGGYVYMDDISWEGGSVAEAVLRLRKLGFREIFRRDTGAFFQRVK